MRPVRLLPCLALMSSACHEGTSLEFPVPLGDLGLAILDRAAPADLSAPDLTPPDLAPPPPDLVELQCSGPPLTPKLPSLTLPNQFPGSYALGVGDLDGDSRVDVVRGGPGVVVAFGAGDGTLGGAVKLSDSETGSVALVDLNRDGLLDIVTADFNSDMAVLLNLGQRSFAKPVHYPTLRGGALNVAAGDVDQDGKPDVLVGNGSLDVELHAGKGDGTLAPPLAVADSVDPSTLLVIDVDADGHLDLVGSSLGGGGMQVRYGDGTGKFPRRADVTDQLLQGSVDSGQVVDVDGDQRLDLLMPPQGGSTLVIALNLGDGKFAAPVHVPYDGGNFALTHGLALLDLDGKNGPDLIPVMSNGGPFEVLFNQGHGKFGAPVRIANVGDCVAPRGLAVADFNGDKQPDVACGVDGSTLLPILLGTCH